MKHYVPFRLVLEMPTEDTARQRLGCQVAGLHADWVCGKIRQLPWGSREKQALLEAVIHTAKAGPPKKDLP